ncbi:Ubiquitin-conjugating enzyme E2 15 [Marasmius crinis-equi]|uniref:Ubiquitin-conjugating enzyme E2 15 n=1 Tax=Marasmius crinis-equi TaxID=585013 RepID=A0ABR3FVX4_9AGAR
MSKPGTPSNSNTLLLRRQLTELTKRPVEGFSAGLHPIVILKAMPQANLHEFYQDGVVCISILHAPGDDQYGYEDAGERWMPVHTVESILVSVISLLSSDTPNLDSPANVDAAKEVRTDLQGYRKKVRRLVRRSAEEAFD